MMTKRKKKKKKRGGRPRPQKIGCPKADERTRRKPIEDRRRRTKGEDRTSETEFDYMSVKYRLLTGRSKQVVMV